MAAKTKTDPAKQVIIFNFIY